MKLFIKILLTVILFTSCGGTWENDDDNWGKTFGEEKPQNINLINSYFWKSSHWTYEFITYMEIEYNQEWLKKMTNDYEMEASLTFSHSEIGFEEDKPKWFAPKPETEYILLKSNKLSEAKILIDKKTNIIFFSFNQL